MKHALVEKLKTDKIPFIKSERMREHKHNQMIILCYIA